jgi:predicted ATPase
MHLKKGVTMRQTRWCVITGAPCSGKTTVIEALQRRGYRVVPEVARAYIERQLAAGFTLSQVKADKRRFERDILEKKRAIEAALPADRLIFLDRALPDSIAYFLFSGLDPGEAERACRAVRYQRIFFLERVGQHRDAVRQENRSEMARLEALLRQSYRRLGYPLREVPVNAVAVRVAAILSQL